MSYIKLYNGMNKEYSEVFTDYFINSIISLCDPSLQGCKVRRIKIDEKPNYIDTICFYDKDETTLTIRLMDNNINIYLNDPNGIIAIYRQLIVLKKIEYYLEHWGL